MQKNYMGLKRKLLYDGEELPGLAECSLVKDEETNIDVPTFNRIFSIKSGVKRFEPINIKYVVTRETKTKKFLHDWFKNNEYHDVTVINTDSTGEEVDRWLLRDCECSRYEEPDYVASDVVYFGISGTILCTTEPVRLD